VSVPKVQDRSRPRKKIVRSPARKQQIQRVQRVQRRRWALIWLGLTAVAVVSASAGALLAFSLSSTPLRQVELTPEEEAVFSQDEAIATQNLNVPSLTRPVHILLIGTKVLASDIDEPTEEELGYDALVNSFDGLADTLLLLRFDPAADKLSVLSIPRDTRAYIEGHGRRKINAANYYGGPALTAKAISNLLDGVQIDRYVRVNVQGVEKLIDALGGVEVYVPKDMKYTDNSQHLYIDLKEGEQVLDGDKALQFLRFRHDRYGDIGRVQRQQVLIRAAIEQLLKPRTLLKVRDILQIIQSHIDTNLSVEELVALSGFASKIQRSQVQMMIVPGDFNGTGEREVSYWLPNRRKIKEVMAQHFDRGDGDREARSPAYLNVAIQNSTDSAIAAQDLRRTLRESGYPNVYVEGTWSEPLEMTRIVAQKGDLESAKALQTALGFGEVRVESTGILTSDITIQLGRDWLEILEASDRFIESE